MPDEGVPGDRSSNCAALVVRKDMRIYLMRNLLMEGCFVDEALGVVERDKRKTVVVMKTLCGDRI